MVGGRGRSGLLALVLVTTLVINLPINGDQVDWSVQSPPSDWASVHDRWQVAHVVRTVSAVLAFGALIVAAVSRPTRSEHVEVVGAEPVFSAVRRRSSGD